MPDACHALKNLKSAVLRGNIRLPQFYVAKNNLPSDIVDGKYIQMLWEAETRANKELRLLHHLKRMMCRYHKVSRYDRTLKK
jgi:hypothetical protein